MIGLTASSTLSLWNQFDIEGAFQGQTWYDRANVGILDATSGARDSVDPDGGGVSPVPCSDPRCTAGGVSCI